MKSSTMVSLRSVYIYSNKQKYLKSLGQAPAFPNKHFTHKIPGIKSAKFKFWDFRWFSGFLFTGTYDFYDLKLVSAVFIKFYFYTKW